MVNGSNPCNLLKMKKRYPAETMEKFSLLKHFWQSQNSSKQMPADRKSRQQVSFRSSESRCTKLREVSTSKTKFENFGPFQLVQSFPFSFPIHQLRLIGLVSFPGPIFSVSESHKNIPIPTDYGGIAKSRVYRGTSSTMLKCVICSNKEVLAVSRTPGLKDIVQVNIDNLNHIIHGNVTQLWGWRVNRSPSIASLANGHLS